MLGTSLLWRSAVAFTYLKVKSAKCLCLLPVVLVLVLSFWSSSWSCYFGLGLKNLVLFTSLSLLPCRHHLAPWPLQRRSPSSAILGVVKCLFSFIKLWKMNRHQTMTSDGSVNTSPVLWVTGIVMGRLCVYAVMWCDQIDRSRSVRQSMWRFTVLCGAAAGRSHNQHKSRCQGLTYETLYI